MRAPEPDAAFFETNAPLTLALPTDHTTRVRSTSRAKQFRGETAMPIRVARSSRPGTRTAVVVTTAVLAAAALWSTATPASAIKGGGPATTKARPYAMLIEFEGRQFCGGTLVAPTKVLTAGHCVESAGDVSALRVIGGRTQVDGTGDTVREVTSARMDSRYGGPGYAYDAAVLTLDRPMPYRTIPVAGFATRAMSMLGSPRLLRAPRQRARPRTATRRKETDTGRPAMTWAKPSDAREASSPYNGWKIQESPEADGLTRCHAPSCQKPNELCGSGSVQNIRASCPIAPLVCGVMWPAYARWCADMPPK
ncbi:trypsin-like serine protease [Streptomyces canus]